MPDPVEPDVPGYDHDRAKALYDQTREGGIPQQGTVLLVVSRNGCPYCQRSMIHTNYDQTAGANTPIRWLDLDDPRMQNLFYHNTPGVVLNEAQRTLTLAGQNFAGTPTVLLVRDGTVVSVLRAGEIGSSQDFDLMAAQTQASAATQGVAEQCRAAPGGWQSTAPASTCAPRGR